VAWKSAAAAAAVAAAAAAAVVVVVVVVVQTKIEVERTARTTLVLVGSDRKVPVFHTSEAYVVMGYTGEWGRPVVAEGHCITNFQQPAGEVEVAVGADQR